MKFAKVMALWTVLTHLPEFGVLRPKGEQRRTGRRRIRAGATVPGGSNHGEVAEAEHHGAFAGRAHALRKRRSLCQRDRLCEIDQGRPRLKGEARGTHC